MLRKTEKNSKISISIAILNVIKHISLSHFFESNKNSHKKNYFKTYLKRNAKFLSQCFCWKICCTQRKKK